MKQHLGTLLINLFIYLFIIIFFSIRPFNLTSHIGWRNEMCLGYILLRILIIRVQ